MFCMEMCHVHFDLEEYKHTNSHYGTLVTIPGKCNIMIKYEHDIFFILGL